MDISSKKVIDKMGDLVNKARHTDSREKLNGYVTAIHALCDLLLEEKEGTSVAGGSIQQTPAFNQPIHQSLPVPVQPAISSMPQSKPVKMEDANGESLFDF